mgnify:CR=1 FL=1
MQLKFDQPIRIEDARKALETNGLADAELQEFGQENKLLIRVKASTTIEEKTAEKVVSIFSKEFPSNKFVVESSTEIGPTIGKKLQSDALVAIVISFAGIILYIAARFELRFGVAAALATFHDVLAVLGAFYILDKEITLLVVTALLTLAGYSLTDTVVVFDKVRENTKNLRQQHTTYAEAANLALNQTLMRSINTSLIAVLPVLFFGFLVPAVGLVVLPRRIRRGWDVLAERAASSDRRASDPSYGDLHWRAGRNRLLRADG